ncbi:MAG TPA: 3-phosphoshikimate 1-carboxyvinyltransferase [Candidatus Eisenbacteria bacterium]|nr:3-phosphoshikimate 1-carboxyvinyltransferase [Candidatus Eisenbacteria bacterium]
MKRIAPLSRPFRGDITVPGDKSIAHRAVIFASVATGTSRIFNLSGGDDNSRTVRAFRQMGVRIAREGQALHVDGNGWDGLSAPPTTIDCGNSGTTMRLLAGVLAGRPFTSRLDGDTSLRRRPMQRIIEPLVAMGARVKSLNGDGLAPLEIGGGDLRGIDYRMPVASAQVKSAILLAGLQAEGITTVEEPVRSRNHTELMIQGFGGAVSIECRSVRIRGRQALHARDIRIPGDLSSAAFFMVAAAVTPGSELVIRDVGCNPTRDGIIEVLSRMGASIELANKRVEAGEPVADLRVRGGELKGLEVGAEMVARTIDEYPALAVAAALAEGTTVFADVKELRYKESDRITAIAEGLRRLGVGVVEREDGLTIRGRKRLEGARVRSFGDHRIAMALAIAGLASDTGVEIDDPQCVDISFPGFFDLLGALIEGRHSGLDLR